MDNKDKKQLDISALRVEITEAVNEVFKKYVGIGLLSGGELSLHLEANVDCIPCYIFTVKEFEYTVYDDILKNQTIINFGFGGLNK